MFLGITRSTRQRYPNDQAAVVARAREHGVERILITGVSLSETKLALALAQKYSTPITSSKTPTHCPADARRAARDRRGPSDQYGGDGDAPRRTRTVPA